MVNNTRSKGESISETEESAAVELESIVHVNTAICYLKLDQPFKCIDHCNSAIALKHSNWKAHLRKGEALSMTADYDKAMKSLNIAKDILLNESTGTTTTSSTVSSTNTSSSSSSSSVDKNIMATEVNAAASDASNNNTSHLAITSPATLNTNTSSAVVTSGLKAVNEAIKNVKEKVKIEARKEKEKLSGFLNKS